MITDTKRKNNNKTDYDNENNNYYQYNTINEPHLSDIFNAKLNFNYNNLNTNSDYNKLSTLHTEYNPNLTNTNINTNTNTNYNSNQNNQSVTVNGSGSRLNALMYENDMLKEEMLAIKKNLEREKVIINNTIITHIINYT